MTDTCETCRFSHVNDDGRTCRRNPPQSFIAQWVNHFDPRTMQPMQIPVTLGLYPPVRPDMWCGEWRRSVAASGLVAVVAADEGEQAAEGVVVPWAQPVGPHASGGGED